LPEVADLLGTLLYYLQFSGKMTQLIITSRYEFSLTRHAQNLVEERLGKIWLISFPDTEQRKKARGLKNIFNYENPSMISYLVSAGQGNPLLMEWLELLASQMKKVEPVELIRAVKERQEEFRNQYKLREPLQYSSKELVLFLRWTGIYRRPVKEEGIQRMAEKAKHADWQKLLSEAMNLSLLEYDRAHQSYQVTPLLREELSAALEKPEVAHEVACDYYRNVGEKRDTFDPLLTEEWIFHALSCGQEDVASQQGAILVNYYREHQALHKSRQVGEWVLSKKKSDSYSEHDTLLNHSLEATLHLLKEHPQQDKHLQQVLQIHRLAYGTEDPLVAVDLKNLGMVYLKTGQKDKARDYLEKAYNILLKSFGPAHPETRKVKESLDRLF
jgi:tetratricopeptide (TPR) repeat protein